MEDVTGHQRPTRRKRRLHACAVPNRALRKCGGKVVGLANLLLPALVAWALCGATIAIVRAVTSLRNALIAHAVAAPVIFGFASLVYFRAVHYTTPFQTAIIYVSLVMVLDFAVVATLVEKSYAMFASILGTWIPFASIFASTYIVGVCVTR